MKSVIIKRWYFILLISVLAISTYTTIKGICYYTKWRFPYLSCILYSMAFMLELLVWYTLIKRHCKLLMAVIAWALFNIVRNIVMDLPWIFKEQHSWVIYVSGGIYFGLFITVLIGGKKFIVLSDESNDVNSD
jgi:hypothetical protein